MKVKKIELVGFKSFADRTEVHLGQGVTCVVGPNGCGKSNISDAIRWVFGERSAKLLRGTRMEDVIFNGTEFRKLMGFAEVSLVIDNEDEKLPLQYAEVVLTRRLYRSGQSEYFLNRTPCRLRDILDLILDTGMGSNSYCMIEQGRVDSVINADPQERRFLIEEAAGISKYKVKREEALRKLERTEQNLLRIRDIVSEVQRNIQYAEKQARRAERYKVQFESLKKLEITQAFLDLSELAGQKRVEEIKKEELARSLAKLEAELREISIREEDGKRSLEEILENETGQASQSFELRSELHSVQQKREFNEERLRTSRDRQFEIEKEQELLKGQGVELERGLEAKFGERRGSEEERRTVTEALQKEEERFETTEKEVVERKTEQEDLKTALFETASQLTQVTNEANRLKAFLETTEQQHWKGGETRARLLTEKEALETKHLSYQGERDGIRPDLSQIRNEIESVGKEATEKRLKLQEFLSRMKLLEELEETREETERKLLASFRGTRLQGRLVQSLREVLQIKVGYEAAVEAVLGAFAQGVVAEDVDTARGLLQEMAAAHLGPCGILIRSLVKPNGRQVRKPAVSHPQVQHAIREVVCVQGGLEPLFEPLFENVFVVEDFSPENLGELLPLSQEAKLVTKQGILLGPEARIFFRNGRLSSDQGPFQRQAEIHHLRNLCQALEFDLENLRQKKGELEERFLHREREEKLTDEKKREVLHIAEEIRVLEAEAQDTAKEASRIAHQLEELEAKARDFEEREKDLLVRQREIDAQVAELQRKREGQIQILTRLKTLLESYDERVRVGGENDALLRAQIEKVRTRQGRLEEEHQELSRRIHEVMAEQKALLLQQETVDQEQKEAERVLNETRGRKAFQEEKYRDLLKQLSQRENQAKEVREGLHGGELKLMELSYREKNITERLEQSYHLDFNELRGEDFLNKGGDRAALEEEIRSLRERVESFGPVNLLAVEEYEELKQRYDFLAGQEKDLGEARESLLEAIRKINRTTKTLFAETFAQAQVSFQEYYRILFGGGHAELLLLEPGPGEESQEAGVDIMVRPPGKKLQHISLLSGGEKALTAMALLFALFRIKPSPLAVLDEVDAPLDEANIDRFLNVLRTFRDSTQFLIITHNRKTIAMGDFLYGVTMEESGVSKIVSVKVSPAEEKVAAV